ncbi:hypothetical protein L486_03063 [Kwoniella mangroviensis CBS 10435]|uniref:Uncharacterized protein n=1 Tax=Kwoniella mangroviensis CBS 10435 TaxID=1331196 RepID=A0A1B9ISS6_9TREE|nr:hypothetical protein L486_03063 [Kwoniella mangroviensis CBS 10435]
MYQSHHNHRSPQAGPVSSKNPAQRSNIDEALDDWFAGKDPYSLRFDRLSIEQPYPAPYEDYEPGWRQPKFRPGVGYEKALAKERMLQPQIGGRSKKAQLGSIEESWGSGEPKRVWLGEEEERKGMFELDEDPPSRNASPFREEEDEVNDEDKIRMKKEEFLAYARRGTNYEKMKDPTDFFEGGKQSVEARREIEHLTQIAAGGSEDPHSGRTVRSRDQKGVYPLVRNSNASAHNGEFRRMSFHAFEYDHSRSQNPHNQHANENRKSDNLPDNGEYTVEHHVRNQIGNPDLSTGRPAHSFRQIIVPTQPRDAGRYHQSEDYQVWLNRAQAGRGRRR